MSSLFLGKTALRLQYVEATSVNLASASSISTAYHIAITRHSSRISLFLNGTSADMSVCFVHPDEDTGASAFRLFAFEIPANAAYNMDTTLMNNLNIDAGTKIYIFKSGGATQAGEKFRLTLWG